MDEEFDTLHRKVHGILYLVESGFQLLVSGFTVSSINQMAGLIDIRHTLLLKISCRLLAGISLRPIARL